MHSTNDTPQTSPPARRPGWVVGGIVAGALLVGGGVFVATNSSTNTTSAGEQTTEAGAGIAEGAGTAGGGCMYDTYAYLGEESGYINTTIGDFDIAGVALSPMTDGGLCGYVAASILDPTGLVRDEQFTISNASIDPDTDDFALRIEHPSGIAAEGVLAGQPTADGGVTYSGTLFDVADGAPAVDVGALTVAPTVA
ncbi:MAG: hypothetical protein AAGF73_17930 [Actinomycetota bacterium]